MTKEEKNLEQYLPENSGNYFETSNFNNAFKIISRHEQIDQERICYGVQKIKGLSPRTFTKVCNAVFASLEEKMVEDEPSPFGSYYVDYNGIRFHLMIGQGSSYWTEKLK